MDTPATDALPPVTVYSDEWNKVSHVRKMKNTHVYTAAQILAQGLVGMLQSLADPKILASAVGEPPLAREPSTESLDRGLETRLAYPPTTKFGHRELEPPLTR